MDQNKKRARELIEMAHQYFAEWPLIGAVEHVHRMAVDADRRLPLAQDEVLTLAEDAVDRARIAWTEAKNLTLNFKTAREEIEAAQGDGFDLIAMACEQLSPTENFGPAASPPPALRFTRGRG